MITKEVFKARLKRAHKSHTMMFNLGSIITTSVIAVIPHSHMQPWHMFTVLILFGVVNLGIRFFTTKDLADK